MPRKWSTRCIWSSGTSLASSALSARALAASVPNGFSSTSRVPGGSSISASACARPRGDRRRQREVRSRPVPAGVQQPAQVLRVGSRRPADSARCAPPRSTRSPVARPCRTTRRPARATGRRPNLPCRCPAASARPASGASSRPRPGSSSRAVRSPPAPRMRRVCRSAAAVVVMRRHAPAHPPFDTRLARRFVCPFVPAGIAVFSAVSLRRRPNSITWERLR